MQVRLLSLALTVVLSASAANTRADDVTANNPLIPPLFSIDPNSPEVTGGLLDPGDLLLPDGPPPPRVEIPRENLSLLPNDDVDALALEAWVSTEEAFVVIFSVDRAAVGGVPPDPNLTALGFPFNVQDQAAKSQAAGDAYMTLLLFDRFGCIPPQPSPWMGSRANNNTVVVNQGDAGGVDFRLDPNTSPEADPNTPPPPQSNANAGSGTESQPPSPLDSGPSRQPPEWLLFSLDLESPSGNGADIYIDRDPSAPGGEELYVAQYELGLMEPNDNIDAMIVFEDGDGLFTPGLDQVIFSLDPNSPSLGSFGPGDLFTSEGMGFFDLYCTAEEIGLDRTDNLNMLDFVPCEHILSCVYYWAIGFVGSCEGDINGDGLIDLADLCILLASYGNCQGDPEYYPGADLNGNGCVDLADLAALLAHYGESCE